MSMPFYVSPEQIIKDKADYARKGIARGRSVVVVQYTDGVLFVAENPSRALHKISEIYDRIAFAAVGRYNEYENLRVAGVRYADTRGYQYDRADVTARGLANWYAQILGTIFTESNKPYEVEILVAQVGETQDADEMFHILYDGTVMDEQGFTVLGGQAETIAETTRARYEPSLDSGGAIRLGASVLAADGEALPASQLEVAFLDRARTRRAFQRVRGDDLVPILEGNPA